MPDDLKPKHDKFTAKVVSDPAKPQNTLLLQGFLGASSQPDYTRVYADLSLDSYVDVANADIIHIEPVPPAQSPMGGSYLWVKKDADVFPGTGTSSASAKAKFLTGAITAEAAASVQPAAQSNPCLSLTRWSPAIPRSSLRLVQRQLSSSVPHVFVPSRFPRSASRKRQFAPLVWQFAWAPLDSPA